MADALPPDLTAISRDAGIFRYEGPGDSRDEPATVDFTVYGDGTIDIQTVYGMTEVSIEALEYITSLARAKRKAAFDEGS